jgi:hypothetical protein
MIGVYRQLRLATIVNYEGRERSNKNGVGLFARPRPIKKEVRMVLCGSGGHIGKQHNRYLVTILKRKNRKKFGEGIATKSALV